MSQFPLALLSDLQGAGSNAVAIGLTVGSTGAETVAVGHNASAAAGSSVVIGSGASIVASETGGVVIGDAALIDVASGTGGGENIAIGQGAAAHAWRGTAVGFKASVGLVSGTAIGRGAWVTQPHAVALGRGSFSNLANTIGIGSHGGSSLYLGSGMCHKFIDPIDGNTEVQTPSACPITIHGFDALDLTTPATNDVAGGPLVLAAGVGTGTGAPGTVDMQVAAPSATSSNTQNVNATWARVAYSTTANDTGLLLWDVSAGSLKRVVRGAPDSGGTGFRALCVAN